MSELGSDDANIREKARLYDEMMEAFNDSNGSIFRNLVRTADHHFVRSQTTKFPMYYHNQDCSALINFLEMCEKNFIDPEKPFIGNRYIVRFQKRNPYGPTYYHHTKEILLALGVEEKEIAKTFKACDQLYKTKVWGLCEDERILITLKRS